MGRVFYFQPGHETYPTSYDANVLRVIENAVRWAAPAGGPQVTFGHRPEPLEKLR
jgi:trehalose utilization protein